MLTASTLQEQFPPTTLSELTQQKEIEIVYESIYAENIIAR